MNNPWLLVLGLAVTTLAFVVGRLDGAVRDHARRMKVLAALRLAEGPRYANELKLGGWVYSVLRDLVDEGFVERVLDDEIVPGTKSVRRVRWRLRA